MQERFIDNKREGLTYSIKLRHYNDGYNLKYEWIQEEDLKKARKIKNELEKLVKLPNEDYAENRDKVMEKIIKIKFNQ